MPKLTPDQAEAFAIALDEFVAKALAGSTISFGGREKVEPKDMRKVFNRAQLIELARQIDPRGYADLLRALEGN